jgi:hypothetical protein
MTRLDRETAEAHVSRVLEERSAQLKEQIEAIGRALCEPIPLSDLGGNGQGADLDDERSPDPEFLSLSVKSLVECPDQVSLLDRLIEGASRCFSRACLFIVHEGTARGWSSVGLPESEGEDPARSLEVSLGEDSLLKTAGMTRRGAWREDLTENPLFLPPPVIGQRLPRRALAAPLLVRDRVSAILYGDDGGDGACVCDLASAEILACVASLCAENLALRSSPSAPEVTAQAELELRIPPITEDAEAGAPRLRDPDPFEDPLEEELEAASLGADGPAIVPSLPHEDTRQHEDARRFARLLISELLLYNEDVVVTGRKQRDIRQRLKQEIEKSRRAYDQRVPERIRSRADYFNEELVRTLAEGDPLAMGID